MKKFLHSLILLILLSNCFLVQAQWQNGLWTEKQAYNWYFGFQAGINFNTTPPTAITDSAIEGYRLFPDDPRFIIIEDTGSISDIDGNPLFYTNGMTVWNSNNEIMLNGEGLQTESSTYQTGLTVPAPGKPGIYYIFSSGGSTTSPDGAMVYSEVDMSLDGGLGAITENKNVQIAPAVEERMTAVHHADGQSVWVVFNTYSSNTNEIQAVLVSNEGVSSTPVVSSIGTAYLWNNQGAMKFSPDGSKMAMSRFIGDTYFMEIYNFDKSTGQLTELLATVDYNDIVGNLAGIWALEFSPNGRFLYGVSAYEGDVHQFDLEAGSEQDIKDSRVVVHQSPNSYFSMQLAPDGKIYLASFFDATAPYLSVINFPNNKGIACGFTENSFDLAGNQNQSSLPCFIQSYFGSGILYKGGDCPSEDISFSTLRIAGIESIAWDFGDPASGIENTSAEFEPTHAFSTGGTYTVTATITSNGAQQTATTQITVLPAPETTVPDADDLIQCAGTAGTSVFNLKEMDAQILNGQDATQFTVTYYASETDVTAEKPIVAPDSFSTTGQTIYAKITNTMTGCISVISFALVVNPLPLITNPDDMQQCSDSQTAVFNLTQQNATILGTQVPNSFMVNYYANESDINDNNPISTPESFTSSNQVVYAVVTNTITGCISDSVEFDIVVIVTSLASDILELTGCSPINLNGVASQLESGLILSFYDKEEDALISENAITDAEHYIAKDKLTIIYVRAEDVQGCADVYRLQLNQENCTIPRGISPNNDGMNDNFDLSYLNVKQLNIFNRYGKNVYSRKEYTAEWYGQSDNGNELPTGTYYYMIETGEGETTTGWVYINREE